MISRNAGYILMIGLLLGPAGCRRSAKVPASPQAPAAPAQPLEMPPPPKIETKTIEEPPLPPPVLPVPPQQEPSVITPNVIKLPPPPKSVKQKPARKPRASQRTPAEVKPQNGPSAPPQPQDTPPQPAAAAAPAPVLAEVIPGTETRRLEQSLTESLSTASNALAALQGRKLTSEQSESAARIRAFVSQAQEARKSDIAAAAELARRAALLSEYLIKSLR